ncbi:hypothetical protein SHI21_02970 [Bacteriovorax sp. PP10]|uniref:Uncharacterized protein n=1 Tax=Bacteriovorax antarcticus TaxID=3088717 RepID=A0ABU5VR96_9BACT|nr:hypothetical protein [Bacteriovorax sp. PP10]MEA9355142.1 hypothetical protein [Bacteriovorax sp. PP10]
MKYTFAPKTHLDAFSFFMQVPFYSMWDVFYKKDLVFSGDEVTSIELNLNESPTYRMFYNAKSFHGYIDIREKFIRDDFMNVEVKTVNKNFQAICQESLKEGWDLTFHRNSPVLWVVATSIIVTFFYWLFSVPFNFLNPEIVGNTLCDLNCVNTAWKKVMTIYMSMSVSMACLFVTAYLILFRAKLYKEARFYRSIQTSAILVFTVSSFRMAADVKKVFTQEFSTQVQMVYQPQNFKTTAERGIASQKGFDKVD